MDAFYESADQPAKIHSLETDLIVRGTEQEVLPSQFLDGQVKVFS